MTDPAQPVEATPETDAVWEKVWSDDFDGSLADTLYDHARSLERRLQLAQTENAGHIRIEDELKSDLAQAQAWCAELEKLLAEVVKDRSDANYTLGTDLVDRIDAALAAQNPGMNR